MGLPFAASAIENYIKGSEEVAGNGFIKIYRKLLDNPIFYKPELLQLFLYCLLEAKHTPAKEFWGKTERIIERGQFTTGRFKIASDLKSNSNTVYYRLQTLKKLNFLNIETNNEKSLITIVNYEIYQSKENNSNIETNNDLTTVQQRINNGSTHTKNIKNIKEKEIYKEKEKFSEFWELYPRKVGKKEALKAWDKINPTEYPLILDGVNRAINSTQWADVKYIPYPATFLNGERWTDEFTPTKTEKPKDCPICHGSGYIEVETVNCKGRVVQGTELCECRKSDKIKAITQDEHDDLMRKGRVMATFEKLTRGADVKEKDND